ncbi:MAG: chitobiase/beta-hexosaminidase C-terminal domain-containing protein, partial [Lentisphaerae bacterium]|nr:chitobiase/beta-hexosaminidase C-terminal domain-containing protein [Lentisphaerota bacterium]
PLFTCYNGAVTDETVNPVTLLKKLGVPARGVYGMVGNTHVPKLTGECVTEDGTKTTWGESIYAWLDQALKNIDTATAPEMIPHGGPIAKETAVRLLTVHAMGSIHTTLDGSVPSKASARYDGPVTVKPGDTLKAIVVRPGLKPSRVATGIFQQGLPRPRITTEARVFQAEAGKPFSVVFHAENADGATWYVGGTLGETYREYGGKRFNPPCHIAWLSLDAEAGILSGTPRGPGVFPVIVACVKGDIRSPDSAAGDAILVVVTVTE